MSTDLNMEYQEVKFGEICREVKLTTKDPIADGYDKYIGLEHLDSESLIIKRWGLIVEDNPTFTRVFKKGHILIGKRRPYLKKAAVAEFDGICSSDIIVVSVLEERIRKSFFEFIVQSDFFWDWAIKTSSGSLSPRTKFKDLGQLLIKLPSLKKQDELIDNISLFNKISCLTNAVSDQKKKLESSIYWNFFQKKFGVSDDPIYPLALTANVPIVSLETLLTCKLQNGLFVDKDLDKGHKVPFINVVDCYRNAFSNKHNFEKVICTKKDLETFCLNEGDVLFNRSSLVKSGIGWPFFITNEMSGNVYDCHLIRAQIDEDKILPEYLYVYCLSPWARKYFLCVGQTTTMTTISQPDVNKFKVVLPEVRHQKILVDMFKKLSLWERDSSENNQHLNNIYKHFLKDIFE